MVQILTGVLSPKELEIPSRIFFKWYSRTYYTAYTFNKRLVAKHPCQNPFVHYMSQTRYD